MMRQDAEARGRDDSNRGFISARRDESQPQPDDRCAAAEPLYSSIVVTPLEEERQKSDDGLMKCDDELARVVVRCMFIVSVHRYV